MAFSWLGGADDTLLLLTHELGPEGGLVPTLRTSADGRVWSTVPGQDALEVVNLSLAVVIGVRDGVVAVGSYAPEPGSPLRPAAWRASH